MPFNGSGTFTLAQPAFVPGTTILSSAVNSDLSDIATNGLSKCVTVDGQNPITGQLKFPDGSAGSPSITFGSELTTGFYRASTKKVGVAGGGTAIAFFDQTQSGSGVAGNQFYYANGAIPCPVGAIIDWCGLSGSTVPSGWLFCYGQILNVSSYPELFVALGSTNAYGGNGTTTFGVPDLRGRVTAGRDDMGGTPANRIGTVVTDNGTIVGTTLGSTGGSSTHTLTNSEVPILTYTSTLTSISPSYNGSSANIIFIGTGGSTTSDFTAGARGAIANFSQVSWTSSITTTSNAGGGAHALLQPTIILNKIIFAGRP